MKRVIRFEVHIVDEYGPGPLSWRIRKWRMTLQRGRLPKITHEDLPPKTSLSGVTYPRA